MIAGVGIVFAPLVPWPLVALLAALAVAGLVLGLYGRLRGRWARAGAATILLLALAGPSLRSETRDPLNDIVLLMQDESASQRLGDRAAVSDAAAAQIAARIAALPHTDLRRITVGDDPDNGGTLAMTALAEALAKEPRDRIAGAILVTDGQVHDAGIAPDSPAPINVLLTGHAADWDRRLHITKAPAFGIIGKSTTIGFRIDADGAVPAARARQDVSVSVAIDGAAEQSYAVPVDRDLELPLTLVHAGVNVVQIKLAPDPGELTDRNNIAVLQINGVRDRLRVLLISGQPYAGERTWRNLLKSDSSVDLVHFTILRPPEKEDGVPVSELALIAFPTRQLFVEKIKDFDLIIFDRYPMRGILSADYLANIRDYVLGGGAVLVAAGPEFATADSLYFSALGDVLPARPSTRLVNRGYLPTVSDLGARHPVTEGLEALAREANPGADRSGPPWGRWLQYVDLTDPRGQVVMTGPDKAPLLILDHAGQGRVALLGSDQAWLWSRGFEGGGPQQELLRRIAHWLMKEPDLEEEALTATVKGAGVTIARRSLSDGPHEVTITGPDGAVTRLALPEVGPGLYSAPWVPPAQGLYHMAEGDLQRVFALGPTSPREYETPIASPALLAPLVAPTNGGFARLEDGLPEVRQVRSGRPAAGRGWVGITPRGAYRTVDLRLVPLVPGWLGLGLAAALVLGAWLAEGRRRPRSG